MDLVTERQTLRAIYPTTPNAEIAQRLGISVALVQKRARYLGLRKDPKYLSDMNRKCGMKSSTAKNWKCCLEKS